MSEDPSCASSPCLAHEMADSYAGFLPAGELAGALDHLIALAHGKSRTVARRWTAALGPIVEQLRASESAGPGDSIKAVALTRCVAADLEEAASALLPRIRNDRIHAVLKRLLAEI